MFLLKCFVVLVCNRARLVARGQTEQKLRIIVLRSGPHSGSNWVSQLLAARRLVTFFQFYGKCDTKAEGGDEEIMNNLIRLLENGCNCSSLAYERPLSCNDATRQRRKCLQLPYCTNKCSSSLDNANNKEECHGVAIVGQPFRKIGMNQFLLSLLLEPQYSQFNKFKFISWERTNILKQAISQLKAPCPHASFRNHARPKHSFLWENTTSFFYLSPDSLLRRSIKLHLDLHTFHSFLTSLENNNFFVYRCYYEKFQLNPDAQLSTLFQALHLPRWNIQKFGSARYQSKTLKLSTENLSTFILNFQQVHSFFKERWPCALLQLESTQPEHFDTLSCPIPLALQHSISFLSSDYKKPIIFDCRRQYVCDSSRACSTSATTMIHGSSTQGEHQSTTSSSVNSIHSLSTKYQTENRRPLSADELAICNRAFLYVSKSTKERKEQQHPVVCLTSRA